MAKGRKIALDFEVDKLTNSIENLLTGDSFPTQVTLASYNDLKTVTKNNGWQIDWKYELKQPEREVYKISILDYYIKTLGAVHVGGRIMIIETRAAPALIDKYFKNGLMQRINQTKSHRKFQT